MKRLSYNVVQPQSTEEAVALLSELPAAFDSPTNHRFRAATHLEGTFASGGRRREWVWAARETTGSVVATVAGMDVGPVVVLNHWAATDMAGLAAALHAATTAIRQLGGEDACVFAPAGTRFDAPDLAPWTAVFQQCGWQPLVERVHYEFDPAPNLAAAVPPTLRLEPLTGPDDARFTQLMGQVLAGSLDAHDIAACDRYGLVDNALRTTADLFEADPWECVRLAFTPERDHQSVAAEAHIDPVGYVSWRVMPGGRGYLLSLGVAKAFRGRGYGRQLVALATQHLIAEGATTLVADTDVPNVPMVAAFADVGWVHTETRLDFVLPQPSTTSA